MTSPRKQAKSVKLYYTLNICFSLYTSWQINAPTGATLWISEEDIYFMNSEKCSSHANQHQPFLKTFGLGDYSSRPLPTDHLSLQCAEELRAAAPDHRGGSVGGVLLQSTAVQPRCKHGGGADAVHQQRHLRHQEPAHGGREAPVWDEGQRVSRDWWVMGCNVTYTSQYAKCCGINNILIILLFLEPYQ